MFVLLITSCHFLSDSQALTACKTGLEITIRDCQTAIAIDSGAILEALCGLQHVHVCVQNSFSYISGVWDVLSVCAVNENVWDSSAEIFGWKEKNLTTNLYSMLLIQLGLCDKPTGHQCRTSKVN